MKDKSPLDKSQPGQKPTRTKAHLYAFKGDRFELIDKPYGGYSHFFFICRLRPSIYGSPPPKKKSSYPQKYSVFLKPQIYIGILNFEPSKIARAYVCMKISDWEYPPPPPPPLVDRRTLDEESPFFSNQKFQTSLFDWHLSLKCMLIVTTWSKVNGIN